MIITWLGWGMMAGAFLGLVIGVPVTVAGHRARRAAAHTARDAALAATMAATGTAGPRIGHDAYLISRAAGDVRAYSNGRLSHRLIRRAVTRRIMPRIWRGW